MFRRLHTTKRKEDARELGMIRSATEYLPVDAIYYGDCRDLLKKIEPSSVALSVWSPPYYVGKEYEKDVSYEEWQSLLSDVIALHYPILKPGAFLAINIADILCYNQRTNSGGQESPSGLQPISARGTSGM